MPADPKPPSSKRRPSDPDERTHFKIAVLNADAGECLIHDDADNCEFPLQAHHVVTQQQLRKAGRHDLLWDPANGMTICEGAHAKHTKASRRIPLSRVPARARRFAAEHGFAHVLARYYAAD